MSVSTESIQLCVLCTASLAPLCVISFSVIIQIAVLHDFTLCTVFFSLSFHPDLQDRKLISPVQAASVESVRKQHLHGRKCAGPEQFD